MKLKDNRIIYPDNFNKVYKKALEVLSEIIVEGAVKYPACIKASEYSENNGVRDFFIGTKENNPFIKEFSKASLSKSQEYAISVNDNCVLIEGYDDMGVLYGCVDFYGKYVVPNSRDSAWGSFIVNVFEREFKPCFIQSAPASKNRGLWTWGHVIYDYRGYIDNMLKLKMNTLIIWNDFVPLNAEEIVDYAHSSGVKIIWGFPWLWDTDCSKVDLDNLEELSDGILQYYEKNYAHLSGDGIYFQSFTELNTDNLGGRVIADVVTDFVNITANKIYQKYPDIELQFGLHATSVKNRLEFIKKVDERINIIWEDCGCFPFSYVPEVIGEIDETLDLVDRISVLRGDKEKYGVVIKGLTNLDWKCFEHQTGPYILGAASKHFKEGRIERKKPMWRYVQAGWMAQAETVRKFINLMIDNTKGDLYLTALLEDSMFEDKLFYPVLLLGELMWDKETDLNEIIHRIAMRGDVEFA